MSQIDFGLWLATNREGKGVSQRELARQLDMSNSLISMVDKGDRPPSWELCSKIAKLWGLNESEVRRYAGLEGNYIANPPDVPPTSQAVEIDELLGTLPENRREEILEVVRLLAEQRASEDKAQRGKQIAREPPKQQKATP